PPDAVLGQVGGEPGRAPKAANTDVGRQRTRAFGPPGQRCRDLQSVAKTASDGAGEFRCLAGPSQDQEPFWRHAPTRATKLPWRSTIATSTAVLPHIVANATSRARPAMAQASLACNSPATPRISAAPLAVRAVARIAGSAPSSRSIPASQAVSTRLLAECRSRCPAASLASLAKPPAIVSRSTG